MADDFLRKTDVKRYYKQDLDANNQLVPGTEDKSVWVDVERFLRMATEQGSGPDFVRNIWSFDWDSAERTSHYIKLYDPNDKSVYVPVLIPDKILVESGSGPDYKRQTWSFDNDEANDRREIIVSRVYHAEFSGSESKIDKSQYMDFEVGVVYHVEFGTGPDYVKENWSWDNTQIPVPELPDNRYTVVVSGSEETWPSSRETVDPNSVNPPVYTETTVGAAA